jgi:ketosteroid isomerase-like protein
MAVATSDTAAEARRRWRAAVERRDNDAVASLLAPNVVLNSPIVGVARFEGRQAVADLMAAVIETFDDLRYTEELGEDDLQMLAFRARVRGRDIEVVDLLRVDGEGLITEFTVLIRPMAGLAAVAAALAPHIARGPVQALLLRALATPLAALLALTEPLIPRLIRTRSS